MEGNFLIFNKVTNGIHSSTRGYFNTELYNLALKNGHSIPYEYSISQMDIPMLQNDFKKFQKVRYWNPDPIKWSWACQKMHSDYSQFLRTSPLTFEQAVQAAEKQTSPGYPWNLYFKTKGEVLQHDASYLFIRNTISRIMSGDFNFSLWNQTSPKLHEIRPKKKFLGPTPKVRTFMCCDIIFYLIGIMLYKNQNDSMLSAAYTNKWSAVGVKEEYGGWDQLARVLLGDMYNPNFHCFDVEAMEASMQVPVFGSIYQLRNSNLQIPVKHRTPWYNLQRFYLRCLQFPYVIDPIGMLIMMFGGNISGQLNTLNDNTLGLEFAAKYCIAIHFSTYDEFSNFWDTIRGKLMGDDSIIREHRLIQHFISDMAALGFIVKYESEPALLTKSTFLNRSWAYSLTHGMFVSKPNFAKMLANVYFNKKNNSWRLTYVKLQALRVKFYAFPEKLAIIMSYIQHLEKNHMKDMEKENFIDPILTMKATLATNLPNDQIEFMIYGIRAEHAAHVEKVRAAGEYAYTLGLTEAFEKKYKL